MCFAALLLLGCAAGRGRDATDPKPVTVMTRNLYVGANLCPAITASTVPEVLAAGARIFSTVQQPDHTGMWPSDHAGVVATLTP